MIAILILGFVKIRNVSIDANKVEISSYAECVSAGFPIMESFPEQCATDDGKTFTRNIDDTFIIEDKESLDLARDKRVEKEEGNRNIDTTQDTSTKLEEEMLRFCTQEVLLCHDGSAVGRSEVNCTFALCPNKEYFIGVLEEDDKGEFSLTSNDFSFAIEFDMKNMLRLFKKKEVRMFGEFIKGNILSVDKVEVYDPTRDTLTVGKTKILNSISVTLNSVTDSRCPEDVTCIQAGTVTANLTLISENKKEIIDLTYDDPDGYVFDSKIISLIGVDPYKTNSTKTVLQSDYILDFKVSDS